MRKVIVGLVATTVLALLVTGGGILLGFLDIALSQADERRGILTGRAIEAVRQLPERDVHIEDAVAAQGRQSTWHAYHGDDDSLRVVVVTVSGWTDPRLARQEPKESRAFHRRTWGANGFSASA